MICTRCLQRRAADTLTLTPLHLSRPIPPSLSLSRNSRPLISSKPRYLSSSSPRRVTETPSTPTADEPPFSTPFTPPSTSTSTSAATATDPSDTPQKPARSKIPAGALLKGLGYLKNQDGPRAWADDEYPEWLWGLLDEKGKGKGEGGKTEGAEGEGDMFCELFYLDYFLNLVSFFLPTLDFFWDFWIHASQGAPPKQITSYHLTHHLPLLCTSSHFTQSHPNLSPSISYSPTLPSLPPTTQPTNQPTNNNLPTQPNPKNNAGSLPNSPVSLRSKTLPR